MQNFESIDSARLRLKNRLSDIMNAYESEMAWIKTGTEKQYSEGKTLVILVACFMIFMLSGAFIALADLILGGVFIAIGTIIYIYAMYYSITTDNLTKKKFSLIRTSDNLYDKEQVLQNKIQYLRAFMKNINGISDEGRIDQLSKLKDDELHQAAVVNFSNINGN